MLDYTSCLLFKLLHWYFIILFLHSNFIHLKIALAIGVLCRMEATVLKQDGFYS